MEDRVSLTHVGQVTSEVPARTCRIFPTGKGTYVNHWQGGLQSVISPALRDFEGGGGVVWRVGCQRPLHLPRPGTALKGKWGSVGSTYPPYGEGCSVPDCRLVQKKQIFRPGGGKKEIKGGKNRKFLTRA